MSITITNDKIDGFKPVWATYRGFSLLFDNPGKSTTQMYGLEGVSKIDSSIDDPELKLYKSFAQTLDNIGMDLDLIVNEYLFCPLPPSTYHVTVWDGVNDGNLRNVRRATQPIFREFLENLPGSISRDTEFTEIIVNSPLLSTSEPITFKFDRLSKFGGSKVLVARLIPANENSDENLQRIREERGNLNNRFHESYGINPSPDTYSPHVTLGYFANSEYAELTTPRISHWTRLARERSDGLTITFKSISLFGFLDMVTFFKRG